MTLKAIRLLPTINQKTPLNSAHTLGLAHKLGPLRQDRPQHAHKGNRLVQHEVMPGSGNADYRDIIGSALTKISG